MEETEIWKDVGIVRGIDFTGYFEASTFGNVRSLDRTVECKDGKTKNIKGKTLNPKTYPNGYLFVELSRNGRTIHVLVHRLVLQTFKPNPNPELYPCVNHKDENKTNNHLCNLEWCDYQYNNNYGSHAKRRLECNRNLIYQVLSKDKKSVYGYKVIHLRDYQNQNYDV